MTEKFEWIAFTIYSARRLAGVPPHKVCDVHVIRIGPASNKGWGVILG